MTYRDPEQRLTARDVTRDRQVALAIAPRFLLTKRILEASLEEEREVSDHYERVAYAVEQRTPVLRWTPAPATKRRSAAPCPDAVDPWAQDPSTVPDATRCTTDCFTCYGTTTCECGTCGGTERVRCGGCSGSGKVRGQKAMKNCPECRGKGTRLCSRCTNGRVPCTACRASGAVEAWVAVVVEHRTDVKVQGTGPAASVHVDRHVAEDFDAKSWPNTLLQEEFHDGEASLKGELASTTDARTDRVLRTRIQRFGGLARVFHYRTAMGAGTIEVAGENATVAASSELAPLSRRRALIASSVALGALLSAFALMAYRTRHVWFVAHGWGWPIFAAAFLAFLGGAWLIAAGTLGAAARKLAVPWLGAAALLLGVGGEITLWKTRAPSAARARTLLAENELSSAIAEAAAANDLEVDRPAARDVLDQLHLLRADAEPTVGARALVVREGWYSDETRKAAEARLLAGADSEVAAPETGGSRKRELAKILAPLDRARSERWEGEACLDDANESLAKADWKHGFAHLKLAKDKLGAERTHEVMTRMKSALRSAIQADIADLPKVTNVYARRTRLSMLTVDLELLDEAERESKAEPAPEWLALRKSVADETTRNTKAYDALRAEEQRRKESEERKAEAHRKAEAAKEAAARVSYSSGGGGGGGCTRGYVNKNGVYHCTRH